MIESSESKTPTGSGEEIPGGEEEEKLAKLKERRDSLLKWIESGEGTPADRTLVEKIESEIKEFE